LFPSELIQVSTARNASQRNLGGGIQPRISIGQFSECVTSKLLWDPFGVKLYEMATGRMAFPGNTSGVIFDAILDSFPSFSDSLEIGFTCSARRNSQTKLSPNAAPSRKGGCSIGAKERKGRS
jgi:hypothetical protein